MRTLIVMALVAVACDSTPNNNNVPDMAMVQPNPDLATQGNPDLSPVCSTNPMTHLELINACTNADSVDKMPFYPTLAPNGQLPPLP
jgi:hypothetical protein